MYADQDQMRAQKKKTGGIVCIVAGVVVAISLLLPWLKVSAKRGDGSITMSLLSFEACGGGRCESQSNWKVAKEIKDGYDRQMEMYESLRSTGEDVSDFRPPKKPSTIFPWIGLATLILGVVAVGALVGAGVMALLGKFVTRPIALTSLAMVATGLALVVGCVFLATKPDFERLRLGVSWPFFLFGAGVVTAIAGVQMTSRAFAPPEYDPYADPMAPPPAAM